MKSLIAYPLSLLYHVAFGLELVVFHLFQVVTKRLFGYEAHRRTVDVLSWFLTYNAKLLFAEITISGVKDLPKDRPLIIVSNHQTMQDIGAVSYCFRKYHLKYVAKKELSKGKPSVSFMLREGGSVLIERDNPRQAISTLLAGGRYIEKNNYAMCIFPEGTRSGTGELKTYQTAGIATLLKGAPSALIVPFVIKGHAEFRRSSFLFNLGQKINYTALDPIEPKGKKLEEIVAGIEQQTREILGQ